MQLSIDESDGLHLVRVTGELDMFRRRRSASRSVSLRSSDRIVVDLEALSFVDSAGLHALFAVGRIAKDVGAKIAFVVPVGSPVRRVIEHRPARDVSPVFESLDAAIAGLPGIDAQRGFDAERPGSSPPSTTKEGATMPPRGVKKGTKRARQYEHIKESVLDRGESETVAEEIAARTVNKERARHGEVGDDVAAVEGGHLVGAPRWAAIARRATRADEGPALRRGASQGRPRAVEDEQGGARACRRALSDEAPRVPAPQGPRWSKRFGQVVRVTSGASVERTRS